MIRVIIRLPARRGSRRSRWFRAALAVLVVLAVLAGVGMLHLDVSVTNRFDGRLWKLPSRIHSDVMVLAPGEPVGVSDVERRLERCGYARTPASPARPGQFRRDGQSIYAYLRGFSSPTHRLPDRRVALDFAGGRLRSIREPGGGPALRVVLEPELLATLYGPRQEERRLVRMDRIPPPFVNAVLAAEDSRFFEHHGLDLRGIVRAGLVNVRHGRIVQGGSTITQQTVKNLYLGQERTWWRKAREALMALILDARYPKERILEVYLNEVYLGQRGPVAICGVRAASMHYFGRDVADLSLSEWALLAGLIRNPGGYNPFAHPDRAVQRRDQVLDAMLKQRTAGEVETQAARAEALSLSSGGGGFSQAPYAVDFVQAQLAERFPRQVLLEEGLEIYTTIDTRLQQRAEERLRRGLERLEPERPDLQGALVATRVSSGAILAMVGGRDYGKSQFNRVVQARRQPGSLFKPLVYATGFELELHGSERGLTPATVLEDEPLHLRSGGRDWRPENYDGRFRGPVTARQALEQSLNVPTVRAAQQVGIAGVVETAHRCGVTSSLNPVPSLALGTAEVTPLEMATAYGVFAQQGIRVSPWIIRAVIDRQGKRLEGRALERDRAISPQTAYQVDDLLRGVFERGTARSAAGLGFQGSAAGKTGTTDGTRDAWFVGYTGDLLALVWVGHDDNRTTGLTGATGALPIWVDFAMLDAAPERRRQPAGMVRHPICAETGRLARERCPVVVEEWFTPGSAPREKCPQHLGKFKRWWRKTFGKDD